MGIENLRRKIEIRELQNEAEKDLSSGKENEESLEEMTKRIMRSYDRGKNGESKQKDTLDTEATAT